MSDEADKSFAHLQLKRFKHCLTDLRRSGCVRAIPHMCNSGGYLDLPEAHFSMVRLGILPWGVYPSLVCRRIPGLRSVMSVRSRIVSCRAIQQGDNIGYGLNYQAPAPMMVATVPVGYGDGFPRVRNCGCVLLRGQRAPILGRVSMDAIVIDVSSLLGVHPEEEVTLMGTQGSNSIDAKELANLKGTTPYDILAGWRHRLPRTVLALDADIASNEITESHLGNLEGR
jgi:alanine racemase